MTWRLLTLGLVALTVGCSKKVPKKVESGFDMSKDSLPFANFATGYPDALMDTASMQRMFGDVVCRDGTAGSTCQLTLSAKGYMTRANDAMLGGRCEGFVVLAGLMQAGKLSATAFGADRARDLALQHNTPLQRELAYWFSTQMHPNVTSATKGYAAKDVMTKLVDALSPNAKERFRIGMVKKAGGIITGGHALTPIGYTADPARPGVYELQVYDNNLPGTERTLLIDTKKNHWEYEASSNPSQHSSLYSGDDSNKNLLYLAPLFNRLGELPCPFCGTGQTQVTTSGGVQALVHNAEVSVGLTDGEMSASDGSSIVPRFSDNDSDGAGFIINANANDVTVDLVNGDDGTSTDTNRASVSVLGSNFHATLSNLKVTASDAFAVSGGGRSVNFTNNSGNGLTMSSAVLVGGLPVTVGVSVAGGSTSVSTSVDDHGAVAVAAKGSQGSQITVAVTIENADGGTTSGSLSWTSNGDSALSTSSSDLATTGTIAGTVNNAGSTQTLSNACTDGVKSGTESDVDCGGTCDAKCGVGQGCAAAADCASTFCNTATGKCVATQCENGLKESNESDVDCGGTSSCGGCAAGKSCTSSQDCASGLACDGAACRAAYLLRVTVSGLPATGTLVLTNATDSQVLTVTADGTQTFPARILGAYSVGVTSQPYNAVCAVAAGTGTATADVTLAVSCTPVFSIGGSLSGLGAGSSITLANGAEHLTLATNGTFAFPTRVTGPYSVTIATQPTGQTCTVTGGAGTATADVTSVVVTCPSGFAIGGNLSGLPASTSVILANNGADLLTLSANGPFTFAQPAAAYAVTVSLQPLGASCTVTGGSGTATGAVTTVQVSCLPSGTLDTTFASVGWFSIPLTAYHNEWFKTAVNPDNSQIWVGRNQVGPADEDWIISKVKENGTIDSTFGTGGHLQLGRGTVLYERAQAIEPVPDGGYLVAGTLWGGAASYNFAVARVTPAGAFDPTFGDGGVVAFDFDVAEEHVNDMKRLGDGSMILAGYRVGTLTDVQVVKLTPTGALDTTFGTGGRYLLATPGDEQAQAIGVSTSGDLYIAGTAGTGAQADGLIIKLLANGTPFVPFGAAGVLVVDMSGAGKADGFKAIDLASGQVTVAGFTTAATSDNLLAQFDSLSGLPVASFGTSGVTTYDSAGAADTYLALRYLPATGGFLASGTANLDGTVHRFGPTGAFDPYFATGGRYQARLANANFPNDVVLDTKGRIVFGGNISTTGNSDLGAARLNP